MVNSSVSDIKERRDESRRFYQVNYWDEFLDAYQAIKCRTKPITRTNRKGETVEDTSRTNVAMPELSLIRRRKVARLTAQPPQINYTGIDDQLAEALTSLSFMQFDRSGEALEHRRLVDSGITFGRGISKLFYDTVEITKTLRKQRDQITSRSDLMKMQGASEEDIQAAISEQGDTISPQELEQSIAQNGSEVRGKVPFVKYEGPVAKSLFIGDFFDEPGSRNLNESGWAVENYWETDIWLQKMVKKKYLDDDGQEQPVFDIKAATELLEQPTWNPNQGSNQPYDLRTKLRTFALDQTLPLFPTRLLPGKRWDILECHERDKYGQMWITWVGNEKTLLGRMPYQWDLGGRYVYTEFVPLPDPIGAVGDSIPRLMRFLWFLHNSAAGSRRDLVNQLIRPMILQKVGEDVPDEAIERSLFRVIQVRDLNSFKPFVEPSSLGAAISAMSEEEAQVLRMMALMEPSLNNVESGTDTNPQAGKTATTAVLAAKSADALTQFEIDGLNLYLKEQGEKKLAMNQQMQDEPWSIPAKYVKNTTYTQLNGKTSMVTLDPMDIQADIEVEPEAGSMLAVDDDIHRTAAMQAYQMAMSDPQNWDTNYVASRVANTIRGLDPEKAVPPPQPPPPIPPKVSVSIAVKFETLPSDVQNELLQAAGMQPSEELQARDTMQGVVQMGQAANAADDMLKTPEERMAEEPDTNLSKGVNG